MLKRLGNLIKGFVGLFISGLEKQNPEALIEVERENLRKQIAEYNKGLAAHAAMCERLMSRLKKLEKEEDELRTKTKAHLKAGNREVAGQYAYRLKKLEEDLKECREELEEAEKTYKELIRARDVAIKAAKDKIDTLKKDISEMRMQQAMADLNEMASGMVTDIGGSGDTLDRLHEMVQEERDKAAGRSRMAKDQMDIADIEMMEQEQKALEESALADFAAEEDILLDEGESKESPASESASDDEGTEDQKTM